MIIENSEGKPGTFLGEIHEKQIFVEEYFWLLFDSLSLFNQKLLTKQDITIDKMILFCKLQFHLMDILKCHIDQDDLFEIKNSSEFDLETYWNRFKLIFDQLGKGPILDSDFDDSLKHP